MNPEDKKFSDINDPEGLTAEEKPEKRKKKFEDYDIEYHKTFVCPHCQEEVPYGKDVCPHCRRYLGEGKQHTTYTPISKKKAWTIKIILGSVLLIGLVVFLVLKSV